MSDETPTGPAAGAILSQRLVRALTFVVAAAAAVFAAVAAYPEILPEAESAKVRGICLAIMGFGAAFGIASPGARK